MHPPKFLVVATIAFLQLHAATVHAQPIKTPTRGSTQALFQAI